ncbi:unnamed protein product [Hymenolepis diminuta]|uniref:Uncharacterized protein n=1 Tax=Hymenolepis diminuta TaxID=6216 RepID=A0A564Z3B7_HYMDI|nr:unnamed protein product [Hymenolepis diminuta]
MFVELTKSTKRISSATRKRAEFPDGFETEPDDIRKQILRAENEVKNIESSVDSFEYQIQSLQEEEKLLSKEAAKYPDEETKKARRKEIERKIDAEVIERQKLNLEARKLYRQLNSASENKEELTVELMEVQKTINFLTAKYDSIKSEPLKLDEENAKIEIELRHLRGQLVDTESQIKDLMDNQSKLEGSKNMIASESIILVKENAKLQDRTTRVIDKLDSTKQKIQELSEEEIRLRKSISEMETKTSDFAVERRRIIESSKQIVKCGAITRKLIRQELKKTRHLKETIKYLEENQKTQKEELELLKKSASKQDIKEREKLATQISKLTKEIMTRNEFTDHEMKQIQQLMIDETKLFNEIEDKKRDLSDLHRVFNMKSLEVSQKKRYLQKAQLHHTQVKRDLKLRRFYLNDHRKTLLSLQQQLSNLGKLYKAINVERNERLTLINLAQQRKLMVEEKNYFYENELSILQSGLANKLDQLDGVKLTMEEIRKESISIRDVLSKQDAVRELEEKKKCSKDAFSTKSRELSLLLCDKRSEMRSVEVLKRRILDKKKIEEKLKKDRDQIAKTQNLLQNLEVIADIPSSRHSNYQLRFLDGSDPSKKELVKKEQLLLSSLSKRETELQANQSILNIVDNLVTEMENRKEESSEESLKLVKSINSAYRESYKKEIEMRAACAELRMNILYSEVLKNELKDTESSKKPQRRGKKDGLTPLQDKNGLKLYTSEIIPKLTLSNPEKFFTSYY